MARRKLRNLDNRILKKIVAHGAEYGIDEISTKEVAEEIGITEPTIYVHFHTRNNVLLVANEYAIQELKDASDGDTTLSGKWGLVLKAAVSCPESAKYAYFFRQKNITSDFDMMFDKFVDVSNVLKVSILEHFVYQAAVGSLEVNEENIQKTFEIISSL